MVQSGYFTVGTHGRYSVKGEILHMFDSFEYGNDKNKVLKDMKKHIDEMEKDNK